MKRKILLVEDEDNLRSTIALNLELEGYEVICAENGKEALQLFHSEKFDIIVLDIMLPEINGIDVCIEIRKDNKKIPILFLSAKSMSAERVIGLKAGADDYLTKPFNLEELILRVDILIKRGLPADNSSIKLVNINGRLVNFDTYQYIDINGKTEHLSKKETLLLKLLVKNKNKVVSREEILEKVWEQEVITSGRTIDNFILAFRKYFETDPSKPVFFKSVRGVGYKFEDFL